MSGNRVGILGLGSSGRVAFRLWRFAVEERWPLTRSSFMPSDPID